MPMITVRILKGHPKETKQKIATGITKAVTDATGLAPDLVWIVFDDVPREEWYAGGKDCT